ncbi:MAG TPA: VOC family protein [Pyrinomonadaceae bacterium]|nr:VOC family protein [Pyrinomonadaceae bacterium]
MASAFVDGSLSVEYKPAQNIHCVLEGNMPGDLNFGLTQIGQIAVNATDIDRASSFYKDILGMKHLFSIPIASFFDCQGIMLMLALPSKPEFDHQSSIIYFNVDDIQQATETLLARGVHFEEKPNLVADMGSYDLWMAFFRDSENNLMALRSQVAH